jgi:lysophospholipase L1-like esterase
MTARSFWAGLSKRAAMRQKLFKATKHPFSSVLFLLNARRLCLSGLLERQSGTAIKYDSWRWSPGSALDQHRGFVIRCVTPIAFGLGLALLPFSGRLYAEPTGNGVQAVPARPAEAPAIATERKLVSAGNGERETHQDKGITILQLGDSHTADDYFTGEVRRRLQARYGNGGPGYFVAGCPHPAIHHSIIKASCTTGWTYASILKKQPLTPFSLSGFAASATTTGESISISGTTAMPYDRIEIDTRTGPGRGEIEVSIDNVVRLRQSLVAETEAPLTLSINSPALTGSTRRLIRRLRDLSIKVTEGGLIDVGGVGIFDRSVGVSVSNVGFSGATVGIFDKFDAGVLESELKRLAPDIVILSFGTTEGFHDDIDLDEYRARYLRTLGRIRAALPAAKLVMILPSDAQRLPSGCAAEAAQAICDPQMSETEVRDSDRVCVWKKPPKLDPIRETERDIAQQEKITVWDWSMLMPKSCGAHIWARGRHLMTGDHVHFTPIGYKTSADEFMKVLLPLVDDVRKNKAAAPSRN